MKYTRSAIGLLTREYRAVLKKCLLINLGLFALGITAANAEVANTDFHATTPGGSIVTLNNSITATNGISTIWNENTGGGVRFENPTTNIKSYIGVADEGASVIGTEDSGKIAGQIYAIDNTSKVGARINITQGGIYYTNGNNTYTATAGDEIATHGYVGGAITTALAGKQDTLTPAQLAAANSGITADLKGNYDAAYAAAVTNKTSSVINGSGNLITSGGVYTALAGKQDLLSDENKLNPGYIAFTDAQSKALNSGVTATLKSNYDAAYAAAVTNKTSDVTENSANLITSGGVFSALANKQDILSGTNKLNTAYINWSATQTAVLSSGIDGTKVAQFEAYATTKQDTLSDAQITATNSGITSSKVSTYDSVANAVNNETTGLATKQAQLKNNASTPANINASVLTSVRDAGTADDTHLVTEAAVRSAIAASASTYTAGNGIAIDSNAISVQTGNGLMIDADGKVAINKVATNSGLAYDANGAVKVAGIEAANLGTTLTATISGKFDKADIITTAEGQPAASDTNVYSAAKTDALLGAKYNWSNIQGAANGAADDEEITANTKVYSVAGANEAITNAIDGLSNVYTKLSDFHATTAGASQVALNNSITGTYGKATIFNEADGGGSMFVSNDGVTSYVGVHDAHTAGIGSAAQIYVADANGAAVLDVTRNGMYFAVDGGNFAARTVEANKVATLGTAKNGIYTPATDTTEAVTIGDAIAANTATIAGKTLTLGTGDNAGTATVADGETTATVYTKAKADTIFAAKATTLAGYGITDAYTKTETGTAISNAIDGLSNVYTKLSDFHASIEGGSQVALNNSITGTYGKAKIWNEVDGGGSMFIGNDGITSYVGVHDKTTAGIGAGAQIYVAGTKDSVSYKTILDVTKDGIYYTVNGGSFTDRAIADNEITTLATAKNGIYTPATDTAGAVTIGDEIAKKYNFSAIVGTPAVEGDEPVAAETIDANTPVYSKNATDAAISGAVANITEGVTAMYDQAHTWAEGLLGVDVDQGTDNQLQTALNKLGAEEGGDDKGNNIESTTIAGALHELDVEKLANTSTKNDATMELSNAEASFIAAGEKGNDTDGYLFNQLTVNSDGKGIVLSARDNRQGVVGKTSTLEVTADGVFYRNGAEPSELNEVATLGDIDDSILKAKPADTKYMKTVLGNLDTLGGKAISAGAFAQFAQEIGFNMKQDQLGWDINVDTDNANSFSEKLNSAMYNGLTKKTTERTVVSALNTVGNAFEDKLDGETVIGKKTVAESIQNRIQGAANGDADDEVITADTKVYSVAGANEAIQAALSNPEQDITANEITANSVDTQSLKVAIPASTEPATEEKVIFEAKAGATADAPNVINLNGKTTVEGGLNVDSITMGEKTVNAISSAMINSTNHNANTLATTEAVYAALGKVDHLITADESGVRTFNGEQGEGMETLVSTNLVGGHYYGNLATGTEVARDLVSLDNAVGNLNFKAITATGEGEIPTNNLNGITTVSGALVKLDEKLGTVDFNLPTTKIAEVKAATNVTDAILALDGYLDFNTSSWRLFDSLSLVNIKGNQTATSLGQALENLALNLDNVYQYKTMTVTPATGSTFETATITDYVKSDTGASEKSAVFYTKGGADAAFMAKDATIDTTNLSSGVVTSLGKADTALQANDITSGTADGTIKVKGADVAVAGLGSAAFTAAADYATAAQGALAASSLQGIKDGSEGYITVDAGSNKLVIGKVALSNLASDVTATSIADGGTGFTTSDQVFDALADKADTTDLADYMKTADYTNSETVGGTTTTYLNADKFKDGSIAQAKVTGLTDALDGKADTDLSNITNTGKGVINDLADVRITEAKATSLESTSSTKLATEGQVVTALASKADTGLSNITEAGENKIKSLSTTAMEDKIVTYNTSTNPAEKTVYSAASIKDALDKAGTALQADSALNGAMISAGTIAEGSLAPAVAAKLAKAEDSVQGIEAGGENFVTLSANNKLVVSKITESHIAASAFDAAPTANSSKLLTSGAVAQAISAYTIKSADTDEFNVSAAGVLSVKKIDKSKIDGLGTAAAADIKTSIGTTVADTSDTVVASEKAIRTELDKKVDNTTLAEYLIKDVDADGTISLDNETGKIKVGTIGLSNIKADAFGNIVEDGTNLVRSGVIYTALQGKASLNSDVNFSGLTLGGGAIKATAISNGSALSLTDAADTYATTLATELTVQNTAKAVDGKIGDLSNLGDHSKYDSSHVAATTVVQAINNLDRYITGTGENTIEDKDHYWTGDNVFKKDVTFQSNITVQGTVDATTVDTENLKIGDATVSSIDKGTTAVAVGTGDATKLATTATVLKSAQNAEFSAGTGETLPTSVGTAGTIHAAIVNVATAVDTLGDKVGTVTFKDADGNPTTNNIAATTTDLTSAVTQLDQAIGKVSSITADYAKTVTTTGSSNPADIATAIQNVATAAAAADGNLNFNQKFTTSDGQAVTDTNKATNLTDAINNVAKNAEAAIADAVSGVEAQIHGDGTAGSEVKLGDKAETVIVGKSQIDTSGSEPETEIIAGIGIDTKDRDVMIAAVDGDTGSEVGADFDAKDETVSLVASNDSTGNTTGIEIDNKEQSITMSSTDADYVTTGIDIYNQDGTRTVTLGTKTENSSGSELSHYILEIDGEENTTTIGSGDGKEVVIGEGTIQTDGDVSVGGNLDVDGDLTVGDKFEVKAADGSIKAADGNFTVNKNGSITAAGGNFEVKKSGAMTAAGGKFSVSSYGGITASDGNFVADKDGNVTAAGTISAADGQFHVTQYGGISAANGNFIADKNGNVTATGTITGKEVVANEGFTLAGTRVTAIDTGATPVTGNGSAETMATTATVMTSAENAKYTNNGTGVVKAKNVATLHDAIQVLDNAMGTMDLSSSTTTTFEKTAATDTEPATFIDNATEALLAIDTVVGNVRALDGTTKGNLDGANKSVAEHLKALDKRLGGIKDLGTNSTLAHTNLATTASTAEDGITASDHFNSLDVAMGDRTTYNNENNFTGYVATNDGKDLTTMISEVASNIGEFKEEYSTNLISSEHTVNANLSALDGAIGNMTFAEDITADDLTSVINNVDAKLNHSNEVFSKAINQLDYNYRELRHDFEAGMASQAALSALVPNGRAKGDTQLSVGTGMYKGHTAAAVGGFHWFTDNLLFNAGVAWDNAEATGRMGVTYSW